MFSRSDRFRFRFKIDYETVASSENTALALEAVMCGCPVVFLPNPHLKEIIGQEEHGPDGFAWGDAPAEAAVTHVRAGRLEEILAVARDVPLP